jgi:hypothetical protein
MQERPGMPPPEPRFSIDDVVDFYSRWPELRKRALELTQAEMTDAGDRDLLNWMVLIIDRMGPNDLGQDDVGRGA